MFRSFIILFVFTLSALLVTNVHIHHHDPASFKMIEEASVHISDAESFNGELFKFMPFAENLDSQTATQIVLLSFLLMITIKRKSLLHYFLTAVFYQSSYFRTFGRNQA